jgi:hypothetical protein
VIFEPINKVWLYTLSNDENDKFTAGVLTRNGRDEFGDKYGDAIAW